MTRKPYALEQIRHDTYFLLILYDNAGHLPMRFSVFKNCVRDYTCDYSISESILDKAFRRLFNDDFLGFKLAYPPSDPYIYIKDRAGMETEQERYSEYADIENARARFQRRYGIEQRNFIHQ